MIKAIGHPMMAAALLMGSPALAAGTGTAPESGAVVNVGFVIYTKSRTPGTLNATWNYGNRFGGPGLATGGPDEGFAGDFHVRYYNNDGSFSDEYDLKIVRTGTSYEVTWLVEGKVRARGVGMPVEDGNSLAVGWRQIDR